jgi:SAM-dependent methyltransferase
MHACARCAHHARASAPAPTCEPPLRPQARVANAEAASLPSCSYDVVVCVAALPYMVQPRAALQRWRDWLRPGGRLLVSTFEVSGPADS